MGTTNRFSGNKMKGARAVGHQNHASKSHLSHGFQPGPTPAKQPDVNLLLAKKDKH